MIMLSIFFSCFFIYGLYLAIVYLLDADGAGGKGTWGKLLDTEIDSHIDRNDPNYDSGEVKYFSTFVILLAVSCKHLSC